MTGSGATLVGLPTGQLTSARAIRQVPFATALALTRTAQAAREAGKARLRVSIDNPRPFTVNAVRFERATKANQKARVYINDDVAKGTSPAQYLRALEFGGGRAYKRFEKALQFSGVLEPGEFAIPADGGSIDLRGAGAVGGIYTRILSALRSLRTDPFTRTPSAARSTRRARRATAYFRSGDFIWERLRGTVIRPVLVIVQRQPNYQPALRFGETVERVSRVEMPRQFDAAMQQALATAR